MALYNVHLAGGKTAYQSAVDGGYKGTEEQFNSTLGNLGLTFTATLPTGETTLVFENAKITNESVLDAIYTSIFGVIADTATFEDGVLTMNFPEQEEDMIVKVIVNTDVSSNVSGATGEDGKDGETGADGKSAYEYAQDGGYTGTEEEFTALLGNIDNTLNDINNELDTKAVITSGTEDLTAGTTTLASGTIYCVYE